jgi:hypothetical protein
MANPHNRKPIYYRASNPGLGNVDQIASKVFQFDETGSQPAEVLTGTAVMPPQETLNEIMVWSDSNTLNYAGIADAPMFWGDGGVGGEKILQMINHVAGRKSGLQFYEIEPATDWILAQNDIYTNLAPIPLPNGGIYVGTVNVTVDLRSNDKISLQSFYFNQGKPNAVLYGTHGNSALNNPVGFLPMEGNGTQTINNVAISDNGYTGWQFNFMTSYNGYTNTGKWLTYYVNDVLVAYPTGTGFMYTNGSIASSFRRNPQGGYLQNGDEIKIIISDVPGTAPLVAGQPPVVIGNPGTPSGPQTATASNYVRISSVNDITANGQIRFNAANPSQGGLVQITRYDSNNVDFASKLATVLANRPASSGSNNQYISLGFNIEVDAATGSLTTGYNQLGYNWGMSYSAFDTSTLGGPYANVANPTLKTINGVEVYEFVGTYETGYNIIGVTDSTTPEPILITFRYE